LSALRTGCLYPQETFLVLRLSRTQGHSAAGMVMSLKKYNDTIGNLQLSTDVKMVKKDGKETFSAATYLSNGTSNVIAVSHIAI